MPSTRTPTSRPKSTKAAARPPKRTRTATKARAAAASRMIRVTEWELQRILLDIHDGPVQSMYAALSQLDLLRRTLEGCEGDGVVEARERADRIRRSLETGLAEVRQFIGEFRPPEFKDRRLLELLEALALQHEAATDTRVMLAVRSTVPETALPVNIVLYRVMQEALSNAYRHGGARTVHVTVSPAGRTAVRMTISDDGAGFDPGVEAPDAHFGLKGMRDRVEMIGGRFGLTSRLGRGTQVAVEVPLR
ncbi:MAG: sensor histidine kinase [Gemmatimonadaceae bacterium]|nr:sensor histidine kinase [Gemmatimonadaceae bacterium]